VAVHRVDLTPVCSAAGAASTHSAHVHIAVTVKVHVADQDQVDEVVVLRNPSEMPTEDVAIDQRARAR